MFLQSESRRDRHERGSVAGRIEPNHVWKQDTVDHAVRQVEQSTDLMAHGMRRTENGVGEGQARFEARLGHDGPRLHLQRVFDRVDQGVGDQPDRAKRVMVRERVVRQRDERLDSVCERVEPGSRIEPLRHGRQQAGIDHGDVGNQRAADDRDLGTAGRVRHDAELRHVGTGAGRGRDHDQRRDRTGRLIHPLVVENVAPVRGEHRDSFGGIDHRTASECDQDIASTFLVGLVTGRDLVILRIGRQRTPHNGRQSLFPELVLQFGRPAGVDQPGVGDEHRPRAAQSEDGVRGLHHRPDTEDYFRCMEFDQPVGNGGAGDRIRHRQDDTPPTPP